MSDEIEKNPTPFHIEPMEKGNMLHMGDLVKVIAQEGDDRRDLTVKVRGYISRAYLRPIGRDKNDKRGALLFDAASALTAAALVAAGDSGLSGKEQFRDLAFGLQAWSADPGANAPPSPAAYVFRKFQETQKAEGFGVELHTSRHIKTGKKAFRSAVTHGQHGYLGSGIVTIPTDHTPVATLLISLDNLLPNILSNLMKRRMT